MPSRATRGAIVLALAALAGCRGADARATSSASSGKARTSDTVAAPPGPPAPPVDPDSAYAAAVRAFEAGLPRPTRFEGGAPSREQLVRGFVERLAAGDTAALLPMQLTRAEFARLVYPSSPYTHAPYRQAPDVTWLLLRSSGDKGYHRLADRLAGQPIAYRSHACGAPEREGENTLWPHCTVTVRMQGRDATARLFGVIVEREGRFKFASYSNDF